MPGSAGALVWSPLNPTVGASGAIFGILGALFILERRGSIATGGQIAGLIVLNLVFTFALSSYISVGAHVGGLIGGVVLMWLFHQFRRSGALYAVGATAGVVAVSVVVAYAKVRGLQGARTTRLSRSNGTALIRRTHSRVRASLRRRWRHAVPFASSPPSRFRAS